MNFLSDCPLGLSEISDQRISKHKSLCEGLFGYTSVRSIIDLAAIFTPWGCPVLEIGMINCLYTQTWIVCCCLYLKLRSHHYFCKLGGLICSEGIIFTFASSPCLALRELTKSWSWLEALCQIVGLLRWEILRVLYR